MDELRSLESFIRLTLKRHGVIASNIANVETPGYRARDLRFRVQLEDEMLKLKVTDPKHIRPAEINTSALVEVAEDRAWKDLNNVELDREVTKMVENSILFQAGINLLSSKIRMFKNALRR